MAAPPNPVDNPELYESIVLAGRKSPGVVTLSGHDRKVNWDVKQGSGQSGASTSVKDIPPVEFTCSFYLVKDPTTPDSDDLAEWPDFLALINSTVNGTSAKAVDIYHPDLAENDIKSVCKALVGGVVHDGKGGQTRVVKFIEYKPPKPAGGAPNGSSTKGKTKHDAEDPDAAAKAQLDALTKQYQDTPWS